MLFDPSTPVDDIVALVVEPKDGRYGQLAKLTEHDWGVYGVYHVVFADGVKAEFGDGLCRSDPPSLVRIFYRHNNAEGKVFDQRDAGPEALKKRFLGLGVGTGNQLEQAYLRLYGHQLSQGTE